MSEIGCHTVRRWLQAPHELSGLQAALLSRHLRDCAACDHLRSRQAEVDAAVRRHLVRAAGTISVHAEVRQLLEARPMCSPGHRRPGRWLAAPLAAVAAALLAVVTSLLPATEGNRVPVVGAAWHLVRLQVGYPLTIDPTDPNHVLVGDAGQIYESWNDGGSWRRLSALPSGLTIRALAIDPSQPNRYLVAALRSIYVSPDRGRRWIRTAGSLPGAMNMFLEPAQDQVGVFYLGPSTVWKSVNHGETWFRPGPGRVFAPYGIQALAVTRNGNLWTGIWGGGVAFSRDGGRTWQRRSTGLEPDVLDVAVSGSTVWAAAKDGVYVSHDQGRRWRRVRQLGHIFATSVLVSGNGVLVGGHGVVYRSADGGRQWEPATNGLPLDPYVYGFDVNPAHPERVYASLDSDGVFRSDDGGRTWTAIDNGLPLNGSSAHSPLLLFRRQGALWITDGQGTDPELLTVDRDVALAALSPDGAAAAYLASGTGGWAVRTVSTGGSAAHTIAVGEGGQPVALFWAPNSSRLAVTGTHAVTVTDTTHSTASWQLPAHAQVLGWTSDGRSLLLWKALTHRVVTLDWTSGHTESQLPNTFLSRPFPAPDGQHVAGVAGSWLWLGTWYGSPVRAIRLGKGQIRPSCLSPLWSDDSSRFLLRCGDVLQIWTNSGKLLSSRSLTSSARLSWAPHSNVAVVLSRGHDLRLWTIATNHQRVLIPHAQPVHS